MEKKRVFLMLILLLGSCSSQSCSNRRSVNGYKLNTPALWEGLVTNLKNCYMKCIREILCKSFNFHQTRKQCQLLDRLKHCENKALFSLSSDWLYVINVNHPCSGCSCQRCVKDIKCALDAGSCGMLHDEGETKSGVNTVNPDDGIPFNVWCDMDTDGGGYVVFQRRINGSVDFYRGWDEYKHGFGDVSGEFWLGMDKIYRLIKSERNSLRVDLKDFRNMSRYAVYLNFTLLSEEEDFKLTVGNYSGTAGDSMIADGGTAVPFTTFDQENDSNTYSNCAEAYHGAWWYTNCHSANLNGLYGSNQSAMGINWAGFRGYGESLPFTEMKLRPLL